MNTTKVVVSAGGQQVSEVEWETSGNVSPVGTLPPKTGSVSMTKAASMLNPQEALQASPRERITVDPDVRGGVPCVGVENWAISDLLEWLASGATPERLVSDLRGLTFADVQTALAASASVMRDPLIDWQALKLPQMLNFYQESRAWQGLSDDALSKLDDATEA